MEKGLKINARFTGEGSEGSARRKRAGSKGSEGCGVAGATVLYAVSRQGAIGKTGKPGYACGKCPLSPSGDFPRRGKFALLLPSVSCGTLLSVHSPTGYAGVASGSRTTRAHYGATYERNALRSLVVPPPAGERWCRKAPKGEAAAGGIYTGAEGAHHNPHGRRPCQAFAPFEPSRPQGRAHAGTKRGKPPCREAAPFHH